MSCKFEISGLKVDGDAEFLNGIKIGDSSDVDFSIKDLDIKGKLCMLNDLQIGLLISEIQKKSSAMNQDSVEYKKIQKIVKMKKWDKESFIKCISKHLVDFSEGVLAGIVSGFLMT